MTQEGEGLDVQLSRLNDGVVMHEAPSTGRFSGRRGWQPIETAPPTRDRTTYIVASFPKGFMDLAHKGHISRDSFTNFKGEYYAPTHWLALPEAPL